MTRIRIRTKAVWHETNAVQDGRAIVVSESPSFCRLRLKGCRTVVQLPWTHVYLKAAQAVSERLRPRTSRRQQVRRGQTLRRA